MAQIQGSYTVSERAYLEAHNDYMGAFNAKAARAFGAFSLALAVATLIIRPQAYGPLVCFGIFGFWSMFGSNLIFRRWYKRDIRCKQQTQISMSDEGVSFVSRGSNASCDWSRLFAQMECRNLFLLFLTERIFYIVPKVAFRCEELDLVQQFLTRNVPRRHVPWYGRPWRCSALLILAAIVLSAMFVLFVFPGQPVANGGVITTQRA